MTDELLDSADQLDVVDWTKWHQDMAAIFYDDEMTEAVQPPLPKVTGASNQE